MARLTYTTPLLMISVLALTACPGDDVSIDTEGSSSGDESSTGAGPTTTPPTTTTADSTSTTADTVDSSGTTTGDTDVCAGVECPPGEECIGGACFDCGLPTCEAECAMGETCECPADDLCCDTGMCVPLECPGDPLSGNYEPCLDDMGVPTDVDCDGGGCVTDSDMNPTAGVCMTQGCDFACQCPPQPGTGDAPVTCEDVTGDMVGDCWMVCDGGETCPDGMSCFGGFICIWSEGTGEDQYGDCINGGSCEPPFVCASNMEGSFGWCTTINCPDDAACQPPPGTGDAPAICSALNPMTDACVLDCSAGQTCPDGMDCLGDSLCVWQVPPYGDCLNGDTCQTTEGCIDDGNMPPTAGICSEAGCVDAMADCPAAPATGTSVVTCGDLGGGDTCYLDCSMGETCPDGMACTAVGMGMGASMACMWPDLGLALNEDFEGGVMPAGWTVIDVDGLTPNAAVAFVTDAFVVTDEYEAGVNFGAYSTSWYNPAGASDDWLVSPIVTLGPASMLSWDGWAPDGAYPDGYEVRISTAGPMVADFMANPALFTIADEAQVFTNHMIDLAAAGYMNQDVYIAWRNNSNDEFILVIDNVTVTE